LSTYNSPFAEQVAFFRQKLNLPTRRWDDIKHEAHDRAFIVAGAQGADLLADLNAAVLKAVEQGTGLNAFRQDFKLIIAKNGWTGWTGEGSKEGVAWRTKVIYQTNLSTSYAAGRYQQLTDPDLLSVLPYWQYRHSDGVMYPRPLHVSWHGLTLPPEHPFWKTHYPPNGWGCHCRATAVSKADFLRAVADGKGPAGAPAAGDIEGIDKGFAYAPGASVSKEMQRLVDDKVATLPPPIGEALAKDAATVLAPAGQGPVTVADFIAAGKAIVDTLPDGSQYPRACHLSLIEKLKADVGISTPCATASWGAGAKLVKEASRLFPDAWTAASDRLGPLYVKGKADARGHCCNLPDPPFAGARARIRDFGVVTMEKGASYVVVRPGALDNAVHEFSHRLQAALPALDALFEELHRQRTAGDALERLRDITQGHYDASEVARKDGYANPYQGKEYSGRAAEVMTMALQAVLGVSQTTKPESASNAIKAAEFFRKVYTEDREMVDFTVGLLFHWKPR
jgi:hypothetical protein